jgi:hypothetical protein
MEHEPILLIGTDMMIPKYAIQGWASQVWKLYKAPETAWHTLCDCENLVTLRFRQLAQHVCELDSAFCSRCRAARCMNIWAAQRIRRDWCVWVTNNSILFYSSDRTWSCSKFCKQFFYFSLISFRAALPNDAYCNFERLWMNSIHSTYAAQWKTYIYFNSVYGLNKQI